MPRHQHRQQQDVGNDMRPHVDEPVHPCKSNINNNHLCHFLADLQNLADARRISIRKACVKDMRFVLRVRDRTGDGQRTVTRFTTRQI